MKIQELNSCHGILLNFRKGRMSRLKEEALVSSLSEKDELTEKEKHR